MRLFTTIAEVRQIAQRDVAVIRNLQITQSYFELSAAMAEKLGACANWCSYATWASKQAGNTIRGEDLHRTLKETLPQALGEAATSLVDALLLSSWPSAKEDLPRLLWELLDPGAAADRAANAVARGNQKVYAEIALEFARFIETCLQDTDYSEDHISSFCQDLRPGDPPQGQGYLQKAFRHYYEALFETDAQQKAELILLANIEIGFHEQTRLQPEIAEALESSATEPRQFKLRLLKALFPRRGWIAYFSMWLRQLLGSPTPLDRAISRLFEVAHLQIRLILTRHMMVLGISNGRTLRLSEDLKTSFPPLLQRLRHPDLLAVLSRVDASPDSMKGTGATDWADLPDRLHFIVDLFRSTQEDPSLLAPPFDAEQTAAIHAGILPGGML